jgi:hypothetical protein
MQKLAALFNYFFATLLVFFIFSPALTYADTQPVGTVIQQQTITLPSDLQSIATAKRVVYITSDLNGNVINASGLIITPNVRPSHPNVVAWAHALTGMADQCAPSNNATYFFPEAVDAVKSYLQQGWVVTAPDYAGLGVGGNYQTFVGNTAARSIIDSVRAARNLDTNLTNQWVAVGHSGGGSAPLFAGEIASSYGTELNLKGVVGLAPLSNVDFVAPAIVGTPFQGELIDALYGLSYADSTVDVGTILAPSAKNLSSIIHAGCVFDTINAYAGLTPSQLLVNGQLSDTILGKLAQFDNPGFAPSSAPILLLQGTADQEIPATLTEFLQQEVCAQGSTSYLQELDGVGHDDLPTVTTGLVAQYISDRFNGLTPPNNCQ